MESVCGSDGNRGITITTITITFFTITIAILLLLLLSCFLFITHPEREEGTAVRIRTSAPGRFRDGSENSWSFRGEYYTPEVTQMKFHWNMLLNIHLTFPLNIHLASDNPCENTTDK